MPLPLRLLISHCGVRLVAIQGFTINIYVASVAARVGKFSLVQDDNGVSDVAVNEMIPDISLVHLSPLSPLYCSCNISGIPAELN